MSRRQEVFPKSRPVLPCFTFLMGLMPASQRRLRAKALQRREAQGTGEAENHQLNKQLGTVRFQRQP